MSQSILQIILKVTKEGTGDKEAAKAAKELKGTLNDLGLGSIASASALALVVGGMTAVATFTRQAVDETVKYADQVRQMMQLSGQSAEESSRMLQVMDDLKVEYSTLQMAAKTLSKEGLTLNIETLAKLSDEYNRLGSGAEKTRFLVEKFGKSGMAMAEAMEQGGDKLRSMNMDVEESLVLNQKAIDDARQYQRALDDLNDTWMAVKVTLGTSAIPVLNTLLTAFQNNIEKGWEWQDVLRGTPIGAFMALNDLIKANKELSPAISDVMDKTVELREQGLRPLITAQEDEAAAIKALSDELKAQLKTVESFQSIEDSYQQKVRDNAEERRQIEADKAAYIAQYGTWNVEKLGEFDQALEQNSAAARKNADEHELATKKIILGMLEQQLAMDGLTQGEFDALLQQGQAWGVYSAEVVAQARAAQAEVAAMAAAIDAAPNQKTININVVTTGSGAEYVPNPYAKSAKAAKGYASGTEGWVTVPSGYPNDSYPVMVSSGEKFAVIPASGGGSASSVAGGTINLNVTVPTMMLLADEHDLQERLLPVIREGVRQVEAGR